MGFGAQGCAKENIWSKAGESDSRLETITERGRMRCVGNVELMGEKRNRERDGEMGGECRTHGRKAEFIEDFSMEICGRGLIRGHN